MNVSRSIVIIGRNCACARNRLICDILPAAANGGERGERTLNPGLTFRQGYIGERPFSDDRQRGANVPYRTAVPLWPLADGYAAASAVR